MAPVDPLTLFRSHNFVASSLGHSKNSSGGCCCCRSLRTVGISWKEKKKKTTPCTEVRQESLAWRFCFKEVFFMKKSRRKRKFFYLNFHTNMIKIVHILKAHDILFSKVNCLIKKNNLFISSNESLFHRILIFFESLKNGFKNKFMWFISNLWTTHYTKIWCK